MFFKERLPLKQGEIQAKDEGASLITSTLNCHVKSFRKTDDGKYKSVMLKSLEAVDDIENIAIKDT